MIQRFQAWQRRGFRAWEWSDRLYVRIAPNFGFSVPWFGGRRIRYARHHGLQLVKWVGRRWYVQKQVLGKSRVNGERYL